MAQGSDGCMLCQGFGGESWDGAAVLHWLPRGAQVRPFSVASFLSNPRIGLCKSLVFTGKRGAGSRGVQNSLQTRSGCACRTARFGAEWRCCASLKGSATRPLGFEPQSREIPSLNYNIWRGVRQAQPWHRSGVWSARSCPFIGSLHVRVPRAATSK